MLLLLWYLLSHWFLIFFESGTLCMLNGHGLYQHSHIFLQYTTTKMFLAWTRLKYSDQCNVQIPVMKPLQVVLHLREHIVPFLHHWRLVLIQTVSKRGIVLAFVCTVDCYLHLWGGPWSDKYPAEVNSPSHLKGTPHRSQVQHGLVNACGCFHPAAVHINVSGETLNVLLLLL